MSGNIGSGLPATGGGPQESQAAPAAPSTPAKSSAPLAAVLGVVLPFCTYLYSQQQERQDQLRHRYQQQLQDQQLAHEKDKEQAQRLLQAIQDRQFPAGTAEPARFNADATCGLLANQVTLIRRGLVGEQTLGVLTSLLTAPPANRRGSDTPLACECREFSLQFVEMTLARPSAELAAAVSRSAREKNQQPLNDALSRCDQIKQEPATKPGQLKQLIEEQAKKENKELPAVELKQMLAALETAVARRTAEIKALPLKPRVYIQIAGESQRAAAACLGKRLREYGYALPGIENVGGRRAPPASQLRYFFADEASWATRLRADLADAALRCQAFPDLAAEDPQGQAIRDFSGKAGGARPYHFELWLAAGAP
ncbi:hypothetical protein ED208_00245 [Stagnimonas aquatica]|uniref:Uncharacterized protein n=1 Tax=Stagnimonas aquatica TaxID=2689987 RepID=A0A3N0VJS8_9GAMM|nr:hypothetical protein [Stagnimonas aquatica]ROH93006.1 hypothetical protein ED208_00245 [Stagnimonas aquatica]